MLSQGIERKTGAWDTTSWDTLSSFLIKEEKEKTEESIMFNFGLKVSFLVQHVWFQAICLMTLTEGRSRDSRLFFEANGNIVRRIIASLCLSLWHICFLLFSP